MEPGELVRKGLEKTIMTEHVAVFENEPVSLDRASYIDRGRPDSCPIDHPNPLAFIVKVANPCDAFMDRCFESRFSKYMPLCLRLNDAGFYSKTVVLVIGTLGMVHRKVVLGLTLMGLPRACMCYDHFTKTMAEKKMPD